MTQSKSIAAIILAHHEGLLVGPSVNSLEEACETAENHGIGVEKIICLDRPDELTSQLIQGSEARGFKVYETDFGDQGEARNFLVSKVESKYTAFLDGDDLWSHNWLCAAYEQCKEASNFIVHPQFNWFFGNSRGLLEHIDQRADNFDPDFLRISNYWDALCFAETDTYRKFPYSKRDIERGFAYEDWHWNCETLYSKYVHVVAPDTVHFKRRREGSQTMKSSRRRALMRSSDFFRYENRSGDL